MNKYDDWELYNAFLDQCTCDKKNVKDIYRRFRIKVLACGRHLIEKQVRWSYVIPADNTADWHMEFLDFIDGNGFTVKQIQPNTYHIIPQYPETKTEDLKSCVYKWE